MRSWLLASPGFLRWTGGFDAEFGADAGLPVAVLTDPATGATPRST